MNEVERKYLNSALESMRTTSDERLNETFIHALNLTKEQIDLVNFIFWMCYMIETDMESIIKCAWNYSNNSIPSTPEGDQILHKMFAEKLKGYGEGKEIKVLLDNLLISNDVKEQVQKFVDKNYSLKRSFAGVNDLPYFIDKIRVLERLQGKNRHVRLLYKINNIRNNLSHNKIDELKYEGESLMLRPTKEKLIRDIFEITLEDDRSQSEIWNSLTSEQIQEIVKMREKFPKITDLDSFRKNT